MKQKSRAFSFRGFVALADLIFAVSAGLLLLNPVHFEDAPAPEEAAKANPAAVAAKIAEIERSIPDVEHQVEQLQRTADEVLKNEQR